MTELEKKAEEYAKSIFSTNDKDSAYYQQLMFTAIRHTKNLVLIV